MASKAWFVVRTNPNCELRADKSLRDAGFEAYLPMKRSYHPHRRTRRMMHRDRPFLTGYVFVALPRDQPHFGFVRACDGVKAILGFGGRYEPIGENVIEEIREWIGRQWLDQDIAYRRQRKIYRSRKQLTEGPLGGKVVIASGRREGFLGRVADARNVKAARVILHVFDKLEEVVVPVDELLAVA